jgi:hypothetical protein
MDLYCGPFLLGGVIRRYVILDTYNRAVFLDMQGTLGGNGVDDIGTFEFYPFAINAIKKLN